MRKTFNKTTIAALAMSTAMFVGCEPQDGTNTATTGTNPAATGNADANSANQTPSTMTTDQNSGRSATGNVPGTPTTGTQTTGANPAGVNTNMNSVQARATLVAIGNSGVAGEVTFAQAAGKVKVTGRVTGLTPGEHGFHVHEKGDLSDTAKGESAGGHFNPDMKDHGRPSDTTRHAGDFGNITANDQGVAEINFEDPVVKLDGPNAIIGRSIVIHAQADRFTQPTGDAGGRVAFGKIEAK